MPPLRIFRRLKPLPSTWQSRTRLLGWAKRLSPFFARKLSRFFLPTPGSVFRLPAKCARSVPSLHWFTALAAPKPGTARDDAVSSMRPRKLSCSLVPGEDEGFWEGGEESLRTRSLGDPLFVWVPVRTVRSLRPIRHPVLHPTFGPHLHRGEGPTHGCRHVCYGWCSPIILGLATPLRCREPRKNQEASGDRTPGRWKKHKAETKQGGVAGIY